MKSMRTMSKKSESGFVSIFIVIFFMIFMSIVVVGFLKVINDNQSQASDNDLSASALSSAQSGAEDGKRLLLFCRTKATGAQLTECASALNNTSCDAITGNTALTTALGITTDSGEGEVSPNDQYQQRYTCMTITTQTDSVEGLSVEKGTSELIPLSGVSNFDTVQFSWHATADTRDGAISTFRTDLNLLAESAWSSTAVMRLEFIAYPKTGVNLSTLDSTTRTVFLLPGSGGASVTTYNLNTGDYRAANPNDPSNTEATPVLARCTSGNEYACSIGIQLTGNPTPATYNYFLRVSSIYSSAYIKAELKNAGTVVKFDNVQPIIDVTGRANDVFRRIQTRVQFDTSVFAPQYALEAGSICKNMTVTDSAATSADICNPTP